MNAAPRLERSEGALRLGFKSSEAGTALDTLYQAGCLKVRLPRSYGGAPLEAVMINTAGGLTDGDRLAIDVAFGDGARAVVASQAAERVYRCRDSAAVIDTAITVRAGARAAWLPQETIVFDGARFERETRIDIAADGWFFGVESFVFGRTAMGETVRAGTVFDRWRLYRDGRLVFLDALALGDDVAVRDTLDRPAIAGGAHCLATAVFSGTGHEALVDRLRALPAAHGTEFGVSDLGEVVSMRLIAGDSRSMRRLILDLYTACLADSAFAEPRVWHC